MPLTLLFSMLKKYHNPKEIKIIIPIRCFSCGRPIAHQWAEFKQRVEEKGEDSKKVLDELGLERYCCRSMFLGQVDTLELINKFKKF